MPANRLMLRVTYECHLKLNGSLDILIGRLALFPQLTRHMAQTRLLRVYYDITKGWLNASVLFEKEGSLRKTEVVYPRNAGL